MNLKKFTCIAVTIVFVIVILISIGLRFAFTTVSNIITSGVKQVSQLVNVTENGVSFADYVKIDSSGIYFGEDNTPLINASGINGSLDGIDVSQSDFSQSRHTFDSKLNRALDIKVSGCDVVIATDDVDSIIVDVLESESFKYTFTTSDNTLVIRDDQPEGEKKSINILGYELSFGSVEHTNTYTGLGMIICLPNDFSGEISVSTSSGDLKLGNLELEESLVLSTTDGNVTLSDISAYDITASTSNGRMNLSSLSATELTASTSNARIDLSDLTAKRLSVSTSNASIDFARLFGEKFTFSTSNGDIDGSILGAQSLFSIETNTDRTAFPASVENPRAQYKLTANTSGGDIRVDFLE